MNPNAIIECVPNFSEGRNLNIIRQITDQIESVEGVSLLDVDPGKATNRTVVTFVGHPEQVIEAAFLAISKAMDLIDMRHKKGSILGWVRLTYVPLFQSQELAWKKRSLMHINLENE